MEFQALWEECFMEVFQDYAYYYNTFYEDKDYKAEAQKIHSLLDRYGNNLSLIHI